MGANVWKDMLNERKDKERQRFLANRNGFSSAHTRDQEMCDEGK